MSSFNTKKFIKNCTVVSPMTVALFSNAMRLPQDSVSKTGGNFNEKIIKNTCLSLKVLKLMINYFR